MFHPASQTLSYWALDLLPVDLKGHIQFTESQVLASAAGRHLLMLRGLIYLSCTECRGQQREVFFFRNVFTPLCLRGCRRDSRVLRSEGPGSSIGGCKSDTSRLRRSGRREQWWNFLNRRTNQRVDCYGASVRFIQLTQVSWALSRCPARWMQQVAFLQLWSVRHGGGNSHQVCVVISSFLLTNRA